MSPIAFECLFSLWLCVVVSSQSSSPIVRIPGGLLSGSWEVSTNGRTYASFKGVPYARPPVGKYRFKDPQHMKPWTGTWDATRYGTQCLQYDPYVPTITGSENCLFINVFTPKVNAGSQLPVVIFIHGGAFMYGKGSSYSPVHIMDRDVVAVTFNYRLGPLGFLSTEDEMAPGNAGLKDQSLALRWVKENIVMFGGNPDSITLTGNSAGGASVHYHYMSPLSRGTFARGIAFSGSAFSSWVHKLKPGQKARKLASLMGCPVGTSKEMIECLRYRPAESIVQAQIDMFDWRVHLFTPFTPTAEPTGIREPFFTQYPYHATQSGQMQKLPLIASVCSEEGLYPAAAYLRDPSILPELNAHWDELASTIFEYNDTLPLALRPAIAKKIKQHYLGGQPVSEATFSKLIEAFGDRLFTVDVGKMAQIHAAKSGQPVYMYEYSFQGKGSLSNFMSNNNKLYGASHADDVFHILPFSEVDMTGSEDMKMTQTLLDLIYSYAATGVPKVKGVQWSPLTPGSAEIKYLEISAPNKAEMRSSSDFGHKSFWDSLNLNENEHYNFYVKDEL